MQEKNDEGEEKKIFDVKSLTKFEIYSKCCLFALVSEMRARENK